MIYKSKKEKDQAIVQFVGDCVVNGMKKNQAIIAAQEEFNIQSPATVYLAIRRTKKRHMEEALKCGGVYNG